MLPLNSCLRAQLSELAYPVFVQRCVGQILECFTKELPRGIVVVLCGAGNYPSWVQEKSFCVVFGPSENVLSTLNRTVAH